MTSRDDELEDEGPQDIDLEELGGDESETAPCPACGAEVYEDADRCPACGEFILAKLAGGRGPVLWWIFLGGVAAVAVVLYLMRG